MRPRRSLAGIVCLNVLLAFPAVAQGSSSVTLEPSEPSDDALENPFI
jgi:hypothetical protein